jgi:hypothetical protein
VWDGGSDVDRGPSEVNTHWKADTGFSDGHHGDDCGVPLGGGQKDNYI